MLKEIEIHGKPGNICAVYKINPKINQPTKGLAWGPFDEEGVFRLMADSDDQEKVMIAEYEPQVSEWLEKWWHLNAES